MTEKKKITYLPESCSTCVYVVVKREHRCHRWAPSPGEVVPGVQFLFSYPSEVSSDARCGAGADRDRPGDAALVRCVACLYWRQPGGVGLRPKRPPAGFPHDDNYGYCISHAPYQTNDPRRKTEWVVKHASDCCGDGLNAADAVASVELAEENI